MTSVNYPTTWSWDGSNLNSAAGPTYRYSFDSMSRPIGLVTGCRTIAKLRSYMNKTFLCALMSFACLSRALPQELLFADETSSHIRHIYGVPPERFEPQAIRRIFENVRKSAGRELIHLQCLRNGRDERQFYLRDVGMGTEIGPRPTKEYLYKQLQHARLYLADVISIQGNAVLLMRDPQHGIRRFVIAGRDPLHVLVDGQNGEIIHIGYLDAFLGKPSIPIIFVTTESRLENAFGISLYRVLRKQLGTDFILAARNDPWFLGYMEFPVFWAYGDTGGLPSDEAYQKAADMTCEQGNDGLRCRVSHGDRTGPVLTPPK